MEVVVAECIIDVAVADLLHHFSSLWVVAETLALEKAVVVVLADSAAEVSAVVALEGVGRS